MAYEYGQVKLSDFGIFYIPRTRSPLVASEKVALLLPQFLKMRLNPDKVDEEDLAKALTLLSGIESPTVDNIRLIFILDIFILP